MNDDNQKPQTVNPPLPDPVEPNPTSGPVHIPELTPNTPASGSGSSKKSDAGSGWRDFGSFLFIIGIAIALAFLLISFVFRSYEVDGPSMRTTLSNQDKLIIWKVPRTVARITQHQYVPKRGDIMIFDEADLAPCGQEGTRQLIKRVIGLPGDHVTVKDGHYEIYNAKHPEGFDPDATAAYDRDGHIPTTTGDTDVTLAANQLFMSGDNRPDSCDSRSFGPIATSQIIGKLVIRLLPANTIKLF